MKQTKIRELKENEIPFITKLSNECIISKWDENQIRYELKENDFSNFLVIEIDGKIIGFLDYWITFDSSTICQIAISKENRNKGYASLLMEHMLNDLKNKEVLTSTLEVRVNNVSAINLYGKFGYQIITKKEHYYDDGEDAYYMVKGVY